MSSVHESLNKVYRVVLSSNSDGSLRRSQSSGGSYVCNTKCNYQDFRFNKIAIQGKGPGGKWTRKPLAYRESKISYLFVTRLRYVSTLFLNIFTLLAVTQSVDHLFHSSIVLCEKEHFLNHILSVIIHN